MSIGNPFQLAYGVVHPRGFAALAFAEHLVAGPILDLQAH
jgi:hypothetical protein